MSGSKTAYLSQMLLDHALGGPAYAPPADVWFVLSTNAFDPNSTGSSCGEIANADYARLESTNDATTWAPASAGAPSVKANLNDLTWAAATTDWGTPASVYVADAATLGNLLYGADLTEAGDVGVGDIFKILAGTYIFSED